MKATNNLNQDLKMEIDKLNQRCSHLQVFKEEHEENLLAERQKMQKEFQQAADAKDEEIKHAMQDKEKIRAELETYKSEFQMKMTQVKLMEIELEEKLAKAHEGVDD